MKILTILFFALVTFSSAFAGGIKLLVHENNPVSTLTRSQVADFYMKRVKQWSDGSAIRFFDHRDGTDERTAFLRDILHKSSRDIELYWIGQKLYSGHSAPSQLSSDVLVEMMVARFPGSIGYVSEGFEPSRSVKRISITEL